jgi:release factor glutamine methyltransferase
MYTLAKALAEARHTIDAVDARVLLTHVLDRDSAYLAAHGEAHLAPEACERYFRAVGRRAAGEPVAYITGHREFYGLDFRITPAVLIPRPESELLVELAIADMPLGAAYRVLDLGTGSGCLAISIARERPSARVLGIDRSAPAVALARENAERLGVAAVAFETSDWFEALAGRTFDLIVANPPYVAADDPHLAAGDLRYEPRAALVGGGDGLGAIRHIVQRGSHYLRRGGRLLFEHGCDQGPRCRALLAAAGFSSVATWRDLAGHERVSAARKLDGDPGEPLH